MTQRPLDIAVVLIITFSSPQQQESLILDQCKVPSTATTCIGNPEMHRSQVQSRPVIFQGVFSEYKSSSSSI